MANLGETLVREGAITKAQLAEALEKQKRDGGRVGDALIGLGHLSSADLDGFFHAPPPVPYNIADTGLPENFLTDLLLKIAYSEGGVFTLKALAEKISLPIGLVDQIVAGAKGENLVYIRSSGGFSTSSQVFDLTEMGRTRAESALKISHYLGAAPVPLKAYSHRVSRQCVRQIKIDQAWIHSSLEHLVISPGLMQQLGPAFNSGRSIFLYGPPGTGKSSISEALARSLTGIVYIPYALYVDGQIIRLYDPAIHDDVEDVVSGQEVPSLDVEARLRFDPRWRACRRPVLVVGGELVLENLDLDYDEMSKFYEAPIQLKAANGVLVVDDFGRQLIPPRLLLNRWIVPLERGTDFLTLHTGKKFEVPFDQITVFSTNLKPVDLVDEAFLRRIRHKIKINYQTEEEFLTILRRMCDSQGIEYDPAVADYLLETYYRPTQRPFVGSQPRDLIEQVLDRARFMRIKPQMTREAIDAAAANYFVEL